MPPMRSLVAFALAGLVSTNALAQGDPKTHPGSLSIEARRPPRQGNRRRPTAGRCLCRGAKRARRAPRRRGAHEPRRLRRRREATRQRATPRRRARHAVSRGGARRDRLLRIGGRWPRRQADRIHRWQRCHFTSPSIRSATKARSRTPTRKSTTARGSSTTSRKPASSVVVRSTTAPAHTSPIGRCRRSFHSPWSGTTGSS